MHIKQHKRFGGICICSVIRLAQGKLKFLLAFSFPSSLPAGLLFLYPIKELWKQMGMTVGSQRYKKRKEDGGGGMKRKDKGVMALPVAPSGTGLSHNQKLNCLVD